MYFTHIELPCVKPFFQQAAIGIYCPYLHVGVLLFQVFTGTHYGTTSTCCYHKMRYLTFCLFPYFRPCLLIVCLAIGQVVVLVHIP